MRGVKPLDSNRVVQVCYYHNGVGTDAGFFSKFVGGALGWGLSGIVQDAYRFIANNYRTGDQIYIFGFSRGAYAARSLAGFIGFAGLLDKKRLAWLPEAYKLYRTSPEKREASPYAKKLKDLRLETHRDVPIHFVGVWDTVGALGAPTPGLKWFTKRWVKFHDTSLGKDVRHAYHALAIDERRRPFKPDIWTAKGDPNQVVEQVWFAGVHSNIGGSYKDHVLSDISLKWMMERAQGCGLEFRAHLEELQPQPIEKGRVERSFSTAYKLLRWLRVSPYEREVGPHQKGDEKLEAGINETLHPSAREAFEKKYNIDHRDTPSAAYQSMNLKAAIESGIEDCKA